jgi:DNA-binding MarR family transcriptional regulator
MDETYQPNLMQLLISAGRAMTTVLDEKLLPLDLSAAKFFALLILAQSQDGRALSELAEMLGTGKSNMTPLVDRLEQDGLAQRVRSDADRRVVYVQTTSKGLERLQQAQQIFKETSRLVESHYSANELSLLMNLLERFVAYFCQPH